MAVLMGCNDHKQPDADNTWILFQDRWVERAALSDETIEWLTCIKDFQKKSNYQSVIFRLTFWKNVDLLRQKTGRQMPLEMGNKTVRGHDIANRFVYSLKPNVYGIQDNSGGTGTYTKDWMNLNEQYFGYAGGICAENVKETVQQIEQVCSGDFWIDMESSLRTDGDRFDIRKCRRILEICKELIK